MTTDILFLCCLAAVAFLAAFFHDVLGGER